MHPNHKSNSITTSSHNIVTKLPVRDNSNRKSSSNLCKETVTIMIRPPLDTLMKTPTNNNKTYNCKCNSRTKSMLKKSWGYNNNNHSSLQFITRELNPTSSILRRGQMREGNQETRKELQHKEYLQQVDRKRILRLEELMIIMSNISSLQMAQIKDLHNSKPPTFHKMHMLTWFIIQWLPKVTWAKLISTSIIKKIKRILERTIRNSSRILKILHLTQRDQPLLRMLIRSKF